ncbi:MAG: zinc metalloprotease HtpX [Acidimicrobiaceae bacterium]|nr:zinc metalloprotease HtpX [Ilumatobacter sp.]MCB9379493.1 zinc metalloprotease HtpX [Acidimicrobiaceae bacterium]MCO5331172.1 zinc metalloprotease HtpX [Ilumatobacteraceae bacterium]
MFKNTMKTTVLLAAMGGLIVAVAGLIGGGSTASLTIGLGLALVMVGGSYWFSDKLALASAKAHVIQREEAPEFYDIVASLASRAGMPMPRVAISPSEQPNAFATGRSPKHAVVCATTGLLQSMPRAEIEGVMAHELMHVKHRDILIGSVAAAIATAISWIAQMAMFASMFGGGRSDDDRPNPLAMLLMSLLAPIAASLIQMAVSRSREFEADRGAAELLGSGHSLADALERIEVLAARRPMAVAPAQAQAYIHNPLNELRGGRNSSMARLFSTHPATEERIRRLRAI